MAYPFAQVEPKWQQYWRDNQVYRALDPDETGKPPFYILDMFPYPSGAGLHVGHPEGYTATDIFSRYQRMRGHNVLHPMGWDAFGLPAEQYAIKNNVHPAAVTNQNIANFKRQLEMLGLGYDWSREIATIDPRYYKWTQWIFLQLYNSYFDPVAKKAAPISHLMNELFNENYVVTPDYGIRDNPTAEGMEAISGHMLAFRLYGSLTPEEQRLVIDNLRLAYVAEVPVNWCPELGTTLANEEVIDGRSEVGGYPVERRPLRQWMLRITAYADRLLDDLEALQWSDSLKEMQRNWIGRSTGAVIEFEIARSDEAAKRRSDEGQAGGDSDQKGETIEVYTTRPDTIFGATYMVLAPEHPLVDVVTTESQRASVEAYREEARNRSERDRLADARKKTGVFTGGFATNPATKQPIPIWVADYVLMGYGTGAIMAVPGQDQRDWDFANAFGLPIVRTVQPPDDWAGEAYAGDGPAINSGFLDGLGVEKAKVKGIEWLESEGIGRARTNYKLRDWLFSRQRYWGEPFPIVWDDDGNHYAVDENELPVQLPPMEDFRPTGSPEGPLVKATDWLYVRSGQKTFRRETNTMPQWAGSCWYYLRYIDPHNEMRLVDAEKERYWMPVQLYVGGVEHAVLHLLYARFWHKVLHDLGHVSTPEPFMKLVNQGMILGEMEFHFFEKPGGGLVSVVDLRDICEEATGEGVKLIAFEKATGQKVYGTPVIEQLVEKRGNAYVLKANPNVKVDARAFKMSKSRGNVVNPDRIVADYGADVFRLYEMYMGPLEAQKPWATRDIIGMSRFLNRVWRLFVGDIDAGGPANITGDEIPRDLDRRMQRAIRKVGEDIEHLRFNTAIAELIELLNEAGRLQGLPRSFVYTFTLLLAPFAPHIAEEIWQGVLGMQSSVVLAEWPEYDPTKLVESSIEVPVQVNGKLRGKVIVPADAAESAVVSAAEAEVSKHLDGKQVLKRVYVPGKMVNLVVG